MSLDVLEKRQHGSRSTRWPFKTECSYNCSNIFIVDYYIETSLGTSKKQQNKFEGEIRYSSMMDTIDSIAKHHS